MSLPFVRQGYHPSDDDYYVILDVDFNASQEQISSAYKNLARRFHPDKNNQDDRSRREAEIIFEKIKTAYDVLSDPHKRQIYDTLGPEGVKLDAWKLVRKQMTAREIRDEYLRIQNQEQEKKLSLIAKPRASFTLAIDASDLFSKSVDDDLDDIDEEPLAMDLYDSLPSIEIRSMSASMAVESYMATNHLVTLTGNLNTKNGTGDGTFGLNYRYKLSPATQFLTLFQVGNTPVLTSDISHQLNKKTTISARGYLIFYNYAIAPGVKFTLAHKIRDYLTGSVSYKEGISSSVTTSLIYINTQLMLEVTTSYRLSTMNQSASVQVGYGFNNGESKVSVSLTSSSNDGVAVSYGAETRVFDINLVGASLSFNLEAGMTLKLRYVRANHEFNLPIYLSDEIHSAPLFYGTMVPLAAYYILDRCYLRHYKQML